MAHQLVGKKLTFGPVNPLIGLICLVFGLNACSPIPWINISSNTLQPGMQLTASQVEVRFNVLVPETDDNVYLDIVDDVTGIAYNAIGYQMEKKNKNLAWFKLD